MCYLHSWFSSKFSAGQTIQNGLFGRASGVKNETMFPYVVQDGRDAASV